MTTPRLDRDGVRAAPLEQLPAFVRAYAAPDTPVRELRGEIRVGRRADEISRWIETRERAGFGRNG